jgi:hypothetical protein
LPHRATQVAALGYTLAPPKKVKEKMVGPKMIELQNTKKSKYHIRCFCAKIANYSWPSQQNSPKLITEKPKYITKIFFFLIYNMSANKAIDSAGITSIKPMIPRIVDLLFIPAIQ